MLARQIRCSQKVSTSGPAGAGKLAAGHRGLKAGLGWLVAGGRIRREIDYESCITRIVCAAG